MKQYKEIKDGKVLRDDLIMDDVTARNAISAGEHSGITYEDVDTFTDKKPEEVKQAKAPKKK
jgi:hypothetical protein